MEMAIFNNVDYKPFNFYSDINTAYEISLFNQDEIFIKKSYFLISKEKFKNKIANYDYSIMENDILSKQNIIIGKVKNINFSNDNQDFLKNLIFSELKWLNIFLNYIYNHLQTRESENRKLTNHNTIKILIGNITKHISEIDCLVNEEKLSPQIYTYITYLINLTCNDLAKLAGGRAFFSGSVITMLCTFDIVNAIYLT